MIITQNSDESDDMDSQLQWQTLFNSIIIYLFMIFWTGMFSIQENEWNKMINHL